MATSYDYLSEESLFAIVPQGSDPGDIYDAEYVARATMGELLDSTYFVVRGADPRADLLAIWEVRLSLLLFTDQLAAAKREAVALNNALYLHENPGAARPANPPNVAFSKIQGTGPGSGPGSAPLVYPLPTNNDGAISDSLLSLVLSLKAAPSLARVNEIYRLCYQKRLKGDGPRHGPGGPGNGSTGPRHDSSGPGNGPNTRLQASLMSLAYGVIAVLFVSRNYATLESFLATLRADLESTTKKGGVDTPYYSHITLMWLLAKIYIRRASGSAEEPSQWGPLYDKNLAHIQSDTWTTVAFVTGQIAAQLGGELFPITLAAETVSVAEIAELVAHDKISVRTICCLLAVWSLAATNHTKVSENEFKILASESETSGLGNLVGNIRSRWGDFYNKLYGLE